MSLSLKEHFKPFIDKIERSKVSSLCSNSPVETPLFSITIIGGNLRIKSIESRMMVNACSFVKQCLDGKSCESFQNYFQINKHSKGTRNSNKLLKLPSVKLKFGKKSFRFQGAKIFNELPLQSWAEIYGNWENLANIRNFKVWREC